MIQIFLADGLMDGRTEVFHEAPAALKKKTTRMKLIIYSQKEISSMRYVIKKDVCSKKASVTNVFSVIGVN